MANRSERILVIEDSETHRYLLKRVLAQAGFEVWEAADGTTGMHLAAEQPDLILLDVNLPDHNGYEICRTLKSMPTTADIPVLLTSAQFTQASDQVHGLEGGADGYLVQPVEPGVMVATVQALLRMRRAESERRQSEAGFRAVFENAAVGMAVLTPQGKWIRVNQRLCDIVGYEKQELLARTFQEITHPEDLPKDLELLEKLLKGEIPSYTMEKRYIHRDGRAIWINLTASAMRSDSGELQQCIAVVEDISARKAAEESLRRAKQEAETASRAKDNFLAQLSHELRTPLTPVLAAVSLLETDQRLDTELREDMQIIRRNVELEARLIDDLLDLTRIVRGKLELRKERTGVNAILDHAMRTCCSETAGEKRLSLKLNMDAVDDQVIGDPARLEQVFWNLISNAVKFTPVKGRIEIRTSNPTAELVRVSVTDTGVGIEPEVLERIFGAFEQGSRTVTRRFGGLGLGLAIVKAIVQMHGGTVSAASEGSGRGSTFTVDLPLARAATRDRDSAHPAPQAGEDASPGAHALRILLVEDHADTARIISQLLKMDGHCVEVAHRVAEALARAERDSFDLLISDLGLPDGSGLDVMRSLRERNRLLKGIALSGYGQEGDVRRSREAGFTEHLVKPVNLETLQAAIARVA